jgi:hypothetical protein
MRSFRSGSMNQKLWKPVEWVSAIRAVMVRQRSSPARSR